MTVADLIELLRTYPMNRKVVVSSNSDYAEVTDVCEEGMVDRNGYLSIPFSAEDNLKAEDVILLF